MNTFKYISIIGACLLVGCVDLDQYPKEQIAADETFERVGDAKYWTNGMYTNLRNSVYGDYVIFNDVQSDLLNATKGYNAFEYSGIHRWETFNSSNVGTYRIWRESYKAIANINKALEGFKEIPLKNEEERDSLNQYTGEMHLGRAYMYARLAAVFCKVYDQSTANADLGLPLEKIYNTKSKNQRATVQQTYDFILEDIKEAEERLKIIAEKQRTPDPNDPNKYIKTIKTGEDIFTIEAVKALKARVLLLMGNWKDARVVAQELIATGAYPLVQTATELENVWHTDNVAESITQLYVSSPDQMPATNNIYILRENGKYKPYFIPSKWVVDLYENADHRKNIYFKQVAVALGLNSNEIPNIYIVNKYPTNPSLQPSGVLTYAHAPKVFRIAEMYLIVSEAAFKEGNEVEARNYLNQLRKARGLAAVTSSGTALWTEIKNERLRELAFEGFRLLDLKRWKEPVVRQSPQNVEALSNTPVNEFYELNRAADDFKFVWPIPTRDQQHGNLIQNPGW